LLQCSAGNAKNASRSSSASSEHAGDLRGGAGELFDDIAEALACLVARRGGEYAANRAADKRLLGGADVALLVALEVNGAALPRRAENLRDRRLEARVGIRDEANASTASRAIVILGLSAMVVTPSVVGCIRRPKHRGGRPRLQDGDAVAREHDEARLPHVRVPGREPLRHGADHKSPRVVREARVTDVVDRP